MTKGVSSFVDIGGGGNEEVDNDTGLLLDDSAIMAAKLVRLLARRGTFGNPLASAVLFFFLGLSVLDRLSLGTVKSLHLSGVKVSRPFMLVSR